MREILSPLGKRTLTYVKLRSGQRGRFWAQSVWKLKIPKLDENDILVFDLEIERACNASTSNGLK